MEFEHRDQLGDFLNYLGIGGIGVEVGARAGVFSEKILRSWKGECLYLVDYWAHIPGYVDPRNTEDGSEQKTFLRHIVDRLCGRYEGRYAVLSGLSLEVAARFPDEYFDFAYIDADHTYPSARRDIYAWYSKVRVGGLFSGHDYVNTDRNPVQGVNMPIRVKQAVDEFAAVVGCTIQVTKEPFPSWWVVKNGG